MKNKHFTLDNVNHLISDPKGIGQLFNSCTLWGTALVAGGLYLLLQNLGFASGLGGLILNLFWSVLFGVGSFIMITLFATNPVQRWWAAIPGFIFGGIAAVTFIEQFIPMAESITGALFLGSIGAGFAVVYLFNQQYWWAIIPAGIMTSLAVVAGVDEMPLLREMIGIDTGALFLMGMSLTFLAVASLSLNGINHARENTTWALIPAGVLMIIALAAQTDLGHLMENVWPLVAIIGGGAILWRKYRHHSPLEMNR